MIGERYAPLPLKPTQTKRVDFEYVRHGSCTVFAMFEPQQRFRRVEVRQRRRACDFADMLKLLSDEVYPEATCIRLVLDNLSTHTPTALYDSFSPEEAHRLKNRFEFHYTPVHASWLNMVEIELSVLSRQCLKRRIPTLEQLTAEVLAWAHRRNLAKGGVEWHFSTRDARVKLHRLYNYN